MLRSPKDQAIELECPECGAKVKATAGEAESGTLRCPRGHEFGVMSTLGGASAPPGQAPR